MDSLPHFLDKIPQIQLPDSQLLIKEDFRTTVRLSNCILSVYHLKTLIPISRDFHKFLLSVVWEP
jgi:hypothetical protein